MTYFRTLIALAGWLVYAQATLASPFCLPPAPADAGVLRAAPEECLFYVGWNGAGTADAKSENQTEQLLAEEEVKNFVSKLDSQVTALVQQAMRGNPAAAMFADDAPALVKAVLTRPAALYVSKVAVGPMGPDVRAGLVINTGDMKPTFAKLVGQLEALAAGQLPPGMKLEETNVGGAVLHRAPLPPGQPVVVWGFKESYFLVSVGADAGQELVGRLASGSPPGWLSNVQQQAGIERPGTTWYVNVAGILQAAQPLMTDPKIAATLDALGIQNVNHISSVSGFDRQGMVGKTRVATAGEPKGLFAAVSGKALTAADLRHVPNDVAFAVVGRLDLDDVLRRVLEGVAKVDPAARAGADNALKAADAQLGFSLSGDLLPALGDVWCAYGAQADATPGKKAPQVGKFTITVTVRDRKRLDKSYPLIVKRLQQEAEKSDGKWSVKQSKFRGQQVYYVPLKLPQTQAAPLPVPLSFDAASGAITPCWCLTDDRLVVSSTPQGLKDFLTRDPKAESLAARSELAASLTGSDGPSVLTFNDTAAGLRTMYPALQALIPVASLGLASQGLNVQIPPLPALATLERHARPSIFFMRRSAAGLLLEDYQTVPVVNSRSLATTGVGLALLLPAVQAAREAARHTQSNNNLKQIGLAMQTYADVNKAFPAAANYDKQGKALLSWRVHVLPYIEQQELYKSFKLDEPWDSPNNMALIARMPSVYSNPNLPQANEGKTNYLAVVGEKAMIQPKKATTFADIKDGTSNTIMVVEAAADRAVIWTKPDDWSPDAKDPMAGLRGLRPGIILVVFGDGHSDAIPNSTAPSSFKAMLTRNAGDVVNSGGN
ncbi:MAG TPA: DUF1559 domain-containing protein [Pirellulales bacterium]|nr:DUF1559 domain-containing protein [Pirellulales bacterium]